MDIVVDKLLLKEYVKPISKLNVIFTLIFKIFENMQWRN